MIERDDSWPTILKEVAVVMVVTFVGYLAIDAAWTWAVKVLCRELIRCSS